MLLNFMSEDGGDEERNSRRRDRIGNSRERENPKVRHRREQETEMQQVGFADDRAGHFQMKTSRSGSGDKAVKPL